MHIKLVLVWRLNLFVYVIQMLIFIANFCQSDNSDMSWVRRLWCQGILENCYSVCESVKLRVQHFFSMSRSYFRKQVLQYSGSVRPLLITLIVVVAFLLCINEREMVTDQLERNLNISWPDISDKDNASTALLLSLDHQLAGQSFDDANDCPLECPSSCVPRNLHWVWFNNPSAQLRFHHLTSLLAAVRFFRPRRFFFWHDTVPLGPYWDYFLKKLPPSVQLLMIKRTAPETVFGRKIHVIEHKSDVMRLEAILKYGGLYVDIDQILVRSIDPLICYSTVLGLEGDGYLSNGFILSTPYAPFVKLWYSNYRDFSEEQWGRFSIYIPWMLYIHNPSLIHVEKGTINRPNAGDELKYLFTPGLYYNLTNNYAVHLWYRLHNVEYDPVSIKNLNTTAGRVFRFIYFEELKLEH